MENISRNLPNICTFSFVRHSKYNRPRGARSSCAYPCACTHDVIQDGAEKADERRKMLFLSPLSTYESLKNKIAQTMENISRNLPTRNSRWRRKSRRKPKIRMRSPNVERNNYHCDGNVLKRLQNSSKTGNSYDVQKVQMSRNEFVLTSNVFELISKNY